MFWRDNSMETGISEMKRLVSTWFEWTGSSPWMLHFQKVRSAELCAITHEDGSARVQTVNARENEKLHLLLRSFARLTGFGVLCNTSLNFAWPRLH